MDVQIRELKIGRKLIVTTEKVPLCHSCWVIWTFQALMVGDDVVNDIGGAQACGLKGVQVRTGKYRYVYPEIM